MNLLTFVLFKFVVKNRKKRDYRSNITEFTTESFSVC